MCASFLLDFLDRFSLYTVCIVCGLYCSLLWFAALLRTWLGWGYSYASAMYSTVLYRSSVRTVPGTRHCCVFVKKNIVDKFTLKVSHSFLPFFIQVLHE